MAEYLVLRTNPKDPKGHSIVIQRDLYGEAGGRLAQQLADAFNKAHAVEMDGRKELEAWVLAIPGIY